MSNPGDSKRYSTIAACLLIAIAGVYLQVARHEFVEFDDPSYVRDATYIRQGLTTRGFEWAFTSRIGRVHPLTWLSHGVDYGIGRGR